METGPEPFAAGGYLASVLVAAVATACALWPPRRAGRAGTAAFLLGFPAELPFLLGWWLVVNTALAYDRLGTPSGLVGLALTVLTVAGLGVLVARALRTSGALEKALRRDPRLAAWMRRRPPLAPVPSGRMLARVVFVPFLRRRRDVERIPDLAYGPAGRSHRLDLYRHRSRPTGAPVFVHFHGGRFVSGAKNRESLPLLYSLAAHGWITVSATYRLGPAGAFPNAHLDAKRVLAWVRDHLRRYGGDPTTLVVAGSSAGAHLALFAALTGNDPAYQPDFPDADTSVLAAVGLGGYYGPLDAARHDTSPAVHACASAPPVLLLHGERDSVVPAAWARRFATTLGAASRQPVRYAELPGAQHIFDYFHSVRTASVIDAVTVFLDWARSQTEPSVPPPAAAPTAQQ